MICPKCGHIYADNIPACDSCGSAPKAESPGAPSSGIPIAVLIGGGGLCLLAFGVMLIAAYAFMQSGAGEEDDSDDAPSVTFNVSAKYAGKWLTSYKKAVGEARKTSRPILADFTGSDWCGWCKKLKKEVFGKREFKRWARNNVVLLEVDFPKRKYQTQELKRQNRKLKSKYRSYVKGYPTILFLDADGEVLGKMGYIRGGPNPWIGEANAILRKRKRVEE